MCELTAGYTKQNCRSVGGVKRFIVYNLENRFSYTRTANAITGIVMKNGKQAWDFQVEMELSNAIQTGTGSRADGTYFYAQAIQMILTDKTQAGIDLMALLGQGRLGVIAFYENGINRHFGLLNGMMVDTDADDSGTELGNRNGNTVALSGREVSTAPTISDALAEQILLAGS
jgi:hypothetical protein